MKQKLLALLKPKLANKGFSQKTIEGLADLAVKNLTDDSTDEDVNTAIDGVVPFAELMQAENTRYANEIKSKLPKVETPKPAETETPKPADNDTPEWAKVLLDKVQKLETEKQQSTAKQKFSELMGKDIPQTRYSRIALPETDEELEALASEIKAEYTAEVQASTNGGLGGDRPQGSQAGPVTGPKPASKEELDSVMNNIKI